jgi:hypothetical protein
MARGWESKAVEADIETAESAAKDDGKERLSSAQIEVLRRREGLLLSRSRVLQDLETTRNERYRKMRQETLAHLEAELAKLENPH